MQFYCLNPFCLHQQNRLFFSDSHHFNLDPCKKWITNQIQMQGNVKKQSLKDDQFQRFQLNFIEKPISSFKTLIEVSKTNWQKMIDNEAEKLKKSISKSIEEQFQQTKLKIGKLLQQSKIYLNAFSIIKNTPTIHTNQYLKDLFQQESCNLDDLHKQVTFKIDTRQLIQKIEAQIQKISETLLAEQNEDFCRQMFNSQDQRCFYQYIFDRSDNQYGKLQILASNFSTKAKNYFIKEDSMSLQCFLCERRIHQKITHSNKKTIKKHLAEQIVIHLYCSHYDQVCFQFTRKQLKTHLIQLSKQQFYLYSKSYQSVHLIDRQTGVSFQENINNFQGGKPQYCVDVVSQKNKIMVKGKHILCQNREDIDVALVIMAYQCHLRGQKVIIHSNRRQMITAIGRLLEAEGKQTKTSKQQTKIPIKKEEKSKVKLQQ